MNIPEIPRPPTDNLYKFVALTGVLMAIVAYVVPTVALVKEQNLVRQIQLETNLLDWRSQIAYDDFLTAKEAVKAGRPIPPGLDTGRARVDAMRRESIRIRSRLAESLQGLSLLRDIAKLGIAMYVVGVALAFWGFRNWYVRLQKPLDEIVRRHALGLTDTGANGRERG